MQKKNLSEIKITNINKNGEIFDPKTYTVREDGNESIFSWLEDFARRTTNES